MLIKAAENLLQCAPKWGLVVSAILYLLLHLLMVAALLTFGQRVGGYPLEPLAVLLYGLLAFGGIGLALWLLAHGRSGLATNRLLPLLGLALFLAVAVVGMYFATEKMPVRPLARFGLRTAYVPLLDDDGAFAGWNIAVAFWLIGVAVAIRWRELLVAGMAAQGLALLFNPGLVMNTLRYGLHGDAHPLLAVPVLYLSGALTLGWRPRFVHLWVTVALLVDGFLLAAFFALQVFPDQASSLERRPGTSAWLLQGLLITGAFYVFVLALPFFALRLRAWAKAAGSPSQPVVIGAGLALLAGVAALSWGVLGMGVGAILPYEGQWMERQGGAVRVPENAYGIVGAVLLGMKGIYPWLLGAAGLAWLASVLRTGWALRAPPEKA